MPRTISGLVGATIASISRRTVNEGASNAYLVFDFKDSAGKVLFSIDDDQVYTEDGDIIVDDLP